MYLLPPTVDLRCPEGRLKARAAGDWAHIMVTTPRHGRRRLRERRRRHGITVERLPRATARIWLACDGSAVTVEHVAAPVPFWRVTLRDPDAHKLAVVTLNDTQAAQLRSILTVP